MQLKSHSQFELLACTTSRKQVRNNQCNIEMSIKKYDIFEPKDSPP